VCVHVCVWGGGDVCVRACVCACVGMGVDVNVNVGTGQSMFTIVAVIL